MVEHPSGTVNVVNVGYVVVGQVWLPGTQVKNLGPKTMVV
jgi:hypothetical protein